MVSPGHTLQEKFTTQLACDCTEQLKTEVELLASREGLSLADFTRRAVLRNVTARKQEAATDVRAYVSGGNERVVRRS
jgi:hypothetical protein